MTKEEVVNNVLLSSHLTKIVLNIGLFILIILAALIILKLLGVKVRFNGKHVQVGESEKERTILRQQTEWAHSYVGSLEYKIPKDDAYNGYLAKFILERCYDEVVSWIMFNHLTLKGDYIKVKQSRIKMIVDTLAVKDEYRTLEFHDFLDECTKEVIENLIHIREVYA